MLYRLTGTRHTFTTLWPHAMKKTKRIALTLLASTCLVASACSTDQKTQRDLYSSKNDCEKDWGGKDCEPDASGRGYSGPHYYHSGGRYWYYPRGQGAPVEANPTHGIYHTTPGMHSPQAISSMSTSHTVRGGFGRFASFHGGGS